jgi:general secretion pathway protein K
MPSSRGGALLAVLWLSAALSAIAFSVANTVRGETERAATTADGVRAYYLATGAIDRALLYMIPGSAPNQRIGAPWVRMQFQSGDALVEIIPEISKLHLNSAPPQDLTRLLMALGLDPARTQEITAAIVDRRTFVPGEASGPFDALYPAQAPSFRPRHASFEEIEELLRVRGVTPELYHGGAAIDSAGRLVWRPGLKDCVSVYGSTGAFEVNTAAAPVLISLGIPADVVAMIVQRRRVQPFASMEQLQALGQGIPGLERLHVGYAGVSIFTLRATAWLRLPDGRPSDLRRSVSALVKFFFEPGWDRPYDILRWYDNDPAPELIQ